MAEESTSMVLEERNFRHEVGRPGKLFIRQPDGSEIEFSIFVNVIGVQATGREANGVPEFQVQTSVTFTRPPPDKP